MALFPAAATRIEQDVRAFRVGGQRTRVKQTSKKGCLYMSARGTSKTTSKYNSKSAKAAAAWSSQQSAWRRLEAPAPAPSSGSGTPPPNEEAPGLSKFLLKTAMPLHIPPLDRRLIGRARRTKACSNLLSCTRAAASDTPLLQPRTETTTNVHATTSLLGYTMLPVGW